MALFNSCEWSRRLGLLTACVAVCISTRESRAGEPSYVPPPWTNVFEGSRVDVEFHGLPVARGAARWRLATSDSLDRALASGSSRVELAGSSGTTRFAVDLPELRGSTAIDAVLHVVVPSADDEVTIEHTLVIYPRNPFALVAERLAESGLAVFDPGAVLEPKLAELNLKAAPLVRADDVARVARGIVIVAEGVSFREFRGLADALSDAAVRGVKVVCLAPADFSLPLPAADAPDARAPKRVALESIEIIRRWDKRFDEVWYPNLDPVIASMGLIGGRAGIDIESRDDAAGYAWLDLEYASKGRLIVCGFGIVRHWDACPTPRYLLSSILTDFAALERPTPVADRGSTGAPSAIPFTGGVSR